MKNLKRYWERGLLSRWIGVIKMRQIRKDLSWHFSGKEVLEFYIYISVLALAFSGFASLVHRTLQTENYTSGIFRTTYKAARKTNL